MNASEGATRKSSPEGARTDQLVAAAIRTRGHLLSPEQRQILVMRWGLDDGRRKTLEEVSVAVSTMGNWPRERCRQGERRGLAILGLE
jgi:DNA-directed RNA polymerase sigma subunit (sigma70/sigma32)